MKTAKQDPANLAANRNLTKLIADSKAESQDHTGIVSAIHKPTKSMPEYTADLTGESLPTQLDYDEKIDSCAVGNAKRAIREDLPLSNGTAREIIKAMLAERSVMIKTYMLLIDAVRDALALGNKEIHVEPEHHKVMLDLRLTQTNSLALFPGKYKS